MPGRPANQPNRDPQPILALADEGLLPPAIAQRLDIPSKTVSEILTRHGYRPVSRWAAFDREKWPTDAEIMAELDRAAHDLDNAAPTRSWAWAAHEAITRLTFDLGETTETAAYLKKMMVQLEAERDAEREVSAAVKRDLEKADDLLRRADTIITSLLLGRQPKGIGGWVEDSRERILAAVEMMEVKAIEKSARKLSAVMGESEPPDPA